jgi:hypothetical protein
VLSSRTIEGVPERSELTSLQRSEHIEEWRALTKEKVRRDNAPLGGAQPSEKGNRKVAKELGISEGSVRAAGKIASITPEAKTAAVKAELGDNQTALLKVAAAAPWPSRRRGYHSGQPWSLTREGALSRFD